MFAVALKAFSRTLGEGGTRSVTDEGWRSLYCIINKSNFLQMIFGLPIGRRMI
jgi:hypothetical protein